MEAQHWVAIIVALLSGGLGREIYMHHKDKLNGKSYTVRKRNISKVNDYDTERMRRFAVEIVLHRTRVMAIDRGIPESDLPPIPKYMEDTEYDIEL